jgi:hypothetical protein
LLGRKQSFNLSLLITLSLSLLTTENQLQAFEHQPVLPLEIVYGEESMSFTLDNQILSGANRPTNSFKFTDTYKGFGQLIFFDIFLKNQKTLLSLMKTSLTVNYESKFTHTNDNLSGRISYQFKPTLHLGFGVERFSSENKFGSVSTTLEYLQYAVIVAKQWSSSSLAAQIALQNEADIEKTDSGSGARRSPQARVSSYLTTDYTLDRGTNRYLLQVTYDFADAIETQQDKPNTPLRVKALFAMQQGITPAFKIEYAYLRNRGYFPKASQPFNHPFNTLAVLPQIKLGVSTSAKFGFSTDIGGFINRSAKKERRFAVIFGFNHQS